MKRNKLILAFTTIAVFATGCSTIGYQKAGYTSSNLQETAQSMDHAIPSVDAVLMALNNLLDSPSEEYESRFDAYRTSLVDFEKANDAVDHNAQVMLESGDAYFNNWELELLKIKNPSIESRSRDRMEELEKRFTAITNQYAQSAKDRDLFLSNLSDIRRALATDLTDGGIKSLNVMQKQLTRDGKAIREKLVDLSLDYKSLATDLSASATV